MILFEGITCNAISMNERIILLETIQFVTRSSKSENAIEYYAERIINTVRSQFSDRNLSFNFDP